MVKFDATAVSALDNAEALKFIKRAGAAYARSTFTTVRDASVATFLAYRDGVLIERGGTKSADTMTTAEYAGLFGLTSHANVRVWRVLGQAIMVVGMDVDGDDYRALQTRNLAQHPAIAEAIMADGATPETVAEAIKANTDENGKRLPVKRATQESENEGGVTVAGVSIGGGLDAVKVLLTGLAEVLGTLSAEDYRTAVENVHTSLAEIDAAREAVTASAAA